MNANRESRRAAARQAGQFSNKRKVATAVATSGLLVSPMLTSSANAIAGPVVTECSTGIGTGSHHNLGWAIDQINNGNGEGQNYGPIGTTITFDLNAPCTLNLDWNDTYVIAENMNIQGPGEDQLKLNVAYSEGSALQVFSIDASSFSPTNTTSLDVTLHGMTIDGANLSNDDHLIYAADTFGPLTLNLDHVVIKNQNSSNSAGVYVANTNSVDGDSTVDVTNSQFLHNVVGLSPLYVIGAPVTVSNSTFDSGDSTSYAGGIYVQADDATVTDSEFINNHGMITGAVVGENLSVSGSTFDSNHSDYAAGAILGYAAGTVTTSTFVGNYSEGSSAGAVEIDTDLSLDQSSFIDNWANYDGGAVQVYGQIVAVNNTFQNNRSQNHNGGAIWAEGGSIQSNTFVDNVADSAGNVIYTDSTVELYANMISQSNVSLNDCSGTIIDAGANLSVNQCGASAFPAYVAGTRDVSATVTAAQLDLKDLALNKTSPSNSGNTKTFALGPNSVARNYYSARPAAPGIQPLCLIDVCSLNSAPTVDQRGVARPQGARNDVGAYEFGVNAATCVPVDVSSVLFKGNSAKLTKTARASLLKDVKKIKASGCHTIVLNGYTAKVSDGSAHKAFRKLLAKKRNAAVKKYLKKQFKAANYTVTFETHALGAKSPVASNKSAKGRKLNRRVEIVIKKLRNIQL